MAETVIAERIGWTGSSSYLCMKVAEIRPDYAPVDPADRIDYEPVDLMQCDLWFPPAKIPLGSGQYGPHRCLSWLRRTRASSVHA